MALDCLSDQVLGPGFEMNACFPLGWVSGHSQVGGFPDSSP